MRKRPIVWAALLVLATSPQAFAQQPAPSGSAVPADYCDSTCRAKRENPKPEIVSPTVSPDGAVTVKIWAPKAQSVAIDGFEAKAMPATKGEDGVWTYTSPKLKPGYVSYHVKIDGLETLDPNNLWLVGGRVRYENMVEIGGGEEFARNDPNIPHGAVAEVFYRTPGVPFERRMRVYTPPGYLQKPETLPTLYLLPGGSQSEDQWPKLGRAGFILDKLIAEGKAKRMIVVMPDGYLEDYRVPSGALPDLFTQDLLKGVIPFIEANYSVSKDPKDRALAGLSRGGGQTLEVVRVAPGTFGSVGIFSYSRTRVKELLKEVEAKKTDADWASLRDALGKVNVFYWTVGTDDGGYKASTTIWDRFKKNGIDVIAEPRPGDHEWWVWRGGLRDFAQKAFPN
jgi:enterochelin esterase family protein